MSSTKTCPSCQIERDLESFSLTPEVTEHAICDFCVELGPKAPPPTPKKRGRKPKEAPQEPTPLPTPQPAQETPQKPPERPVERSPEIQAEADAAFAMPYVAPKFDQQAAATDPVRELAARELARRRLLPFIQRFRPKYMPGWVHKDICRRLERFVADVEAGKEPRLLLMMPPRAGKQLADDTLVPTPAGWRRHGDLAPGDEVFHPSGRPVKVLAVSEKTPSNVKVTFSDGSSYFCHENHEWALYNRMRREWQTIETNHFLKPTRFGKAKQTIQGTRCMYQLPIAEPLRYNGTEFLTHPYVLGAWLGDGSAGKPCITGAKSDKAIIDRVVELGYPVSTVCEHQTTGVLTTYFSGDGVTDVGLVPKRRGPIPGRLSQELEVLGVFKDKHIPESYLRLKTELRLQLVAGLIDTDGHTDKNGRMSFTTASRKLADGVMELLSGLGFRPYIQEIEPRLSTSGIQGQKVYWCIGFQPTMPIPVVLPRKSVSRIAKQRRVGLVSVERVESGKQGHCIQVDSPDGLYVVGEKLTVTHNSEIGSRHFAPWVLGKHPEWEIIAASHTGSLSLSFSRYIRDLLRDPAYNSVFPDAVLDASSQSVENWNLTKGGGYLAAGVGTGITGRGCLAPYTLVDTNRGKMRIIDLKVGDSVYGYDHEHKEVVTTRVKAVQVTERSKHLLDFGKIRLTTDHRIYNASRGFYTRAGESPSLLGLRRKEGASCCDLQGVLFEGADGSDHIAQMRLLWEELHAQRGGAPKVTGSTRSGCEGVLRSSLLRHVQNQQPGGVQQGEGRVPALQETCDGNGSFEVLQQGLLQRVQGFETADGCLQWRVSDAKEAGIGARQEVLALRNDKLSVRCASHQSGRDGQPDFESGAALHGVPPQISSVHGTCAADIAKLFESFDFVVDIQTETGNFFTEGLLVHNCHILILDDLVKDQEAADSPTIRENTWEWYISTAHSRLAPGGGVLGIMTWWSEDDWAGRIQEAMKGDGEKFEIVRYPAINEEGDEYILVDDRIVEIPPNSPVPEGARMTRPHGTALHPERYTTEALRRKKLNYKAAGMIRMWNALYQQNPTPDSGIYFTKDLFRRYAHAPSRRGRTIYQAWDFAITEGEQNDYTVCATILQDEFDNLYVIDIFRFKSDDGNAIVEHMIDQYVMWGVDYLGMEDGQIWKAIRSQFERRCQERKVYPSFEVLQPLTDKLVRANPLKGRMQLGKVYWPEDGAFPWVEPCVRELIVFPNGKHDDQVDACFVAGTPIAMADGSTKPIELVAQGDLVATPIGPRVVTHAWLSKRDADVVEAEFSNGALLRGTAAHPFATDRGWVGLSDLMPSDRLQGIASQQPGESSCQGFTRKQPPTSSDLSSTERFIAATLTRLEGTFGGISRALVAFYTGTFGSFTTALSLKAIKFITRMETISTTTFGTWSASLGQDTKSSILRSEARSEGLTPRFGISRRSARKRLTGTSPRKEGVGTQNMGRRPGKDEPQQPLCAGSVGLDLSLSGRTPHSVQKSVSGETGASATLVMTRRSVLEQRQDVFNISVDEAECYYAAGILVHNCAWAVRMTLNHAAPRDPAPKPKGPESWKTRLARELAGAGGGHMAS